MMRHSKEFVQAKHHLREQEESLKKEIETDSLRLAKSSKKIILVLIGVLIAMIFGRALLRRGASKKKIARAPRNLKLGRLIEFVGPFLFSSLMKSETLRKTLKKKASGEEHG